MTDDLIARAFATLENYSHWIPADEWKAIVAERDLAIRDAARIATQQEELEERCAKAIQGLRNTIGATRSQSIALSYAEAAVRREFGLSKHGQRT